MQVNAALTSLALSHLLTSGMVSELNRMTNSTDFMKMNAYLLVYSPTGQGAFGYKVSVILSMPGGQEPSWEVTSEDSVTAAGVQGLLNDIISL